MRLLLTEMQRFFDTGALGAMKELKWDGCWRARTALDVSHPLQD